MAFKQLRYITADLAEAPQVLVVQPDGKARYLSRNNERFPGRPEVGLYETVLAGEDMQQVWLIADEQRFAQLPDHSQLSMPEGIEAQIVQLQTQHQTLEKKVSPADPVDPRFQSVLQQLDGLVQRVLNFPRRVLRLEPISIKMQGDLLHAELRLSNPGREPLWFRPPADLINQEDGWLWIEAWPAQPAPGSLWSEQKVYINPTQVTLIGDGGSAMQSAAAELQPQASVGFLLSGHFAAKSGEYLGRIVYCNFTDKSQDHPLIVGQIIATAIKFSHP